jgi:hypothetical protein
VLDRFLDAWEDGYAHRTPLVGSDETWSVQAFRIRDKFSVIIRVMGRRHRGTDRLQWFAADGRGLAVLTGPGDVTLAGHGFEVRLETPGVVRVRRSSAD